ncbi:hypothetical protein NW762_011382 [Fusarium torreyae]|uniref:Uncharacterized protein n=1 Tax=Fusarium torreyae TaxID=1237075 RepID=A0A9W8RSB7_9HYPO|nr:hypothetical protein NW762_011382 [Fusarium torreyae]
MTTSKIIIQQGSSSLRALANNGYQLHVAKSVSGPSGTPSFNMVYQSQSISPNIEIQWTATYGLNWTTSVSAPGAQVTISGNWQQCNLGDSYDLDSSGEWVADQSNPSAKSNSLNVGKNGFQEPVNIIIGVHKIWVSPDQLLKQANGDYEPHQAIQMWYAEGSQTSTIISEQATPVEEYNETSSDPEYFSYDVESGRWTESKTPFRDLN